MRITPTTVIAEMIREFKGSTSYFINQRMGKTLYWQDGYGVLSVSLSVVETVKKYVENQKTKHSLKETVEEFEMIEDER